MKKFLFVFITAAIFGLLALRGYARQNAKPLTETNLIDLLKNDVPPKRVGELATQKGIDFELTPDTERALRQAGANAALIGTLKGLAPKTALSKPSEPVRQPVPPAKLQAGSLRTNPKDGQPYVWIPPGSFVMGCSPGDNECSDDEKPPHQVELKKGFWMGQTAVTVAAWKRYRAATGAAALPTSDKVGRQNWNEAGAENMPAVTVTWNQAKSYCEWASMRLPTEAEWEYAARAGATSARYGDLDSIAWYADNSGKRKIDSSAIFEENRGAYSQKLFENENFVHGVALKQPNAWKLYDILGNVYTWTADWYDANYYAKSAKVDPHGPPAGHYRAARGGAWGNRPQNVRLSLRGSDEPDSGSFNFGCRCAGELP